MNTFDQTFADATAENAEIDFEDSEPMKPDDLVERFTTSTGILDIVHDQDPQNPRTEFDNITKMICFHRRYNLGDKHDYKTDDFNGWDELEERLLEDFGSGSVIKPLFMLDHSGLRLSTSSFNDHWDSGQIGFVLVPEKDLGEVPDLDAAIESDVQTYDDFLSGAVYGYIKYDAEGEPAGSCFGFFGDDGIKAIKDENGIDS